MQAGNPAFGTISQRGNFFGRESEAHHPIEEFGGFSGPDGLAVDREGGLAVCQHRTGSVWLFDPLGAPTYRIRSCRGLLTTNATYGPDGRTLFITESETGAILTATIPTTPAP